MKKLLRSWRVESRYIDGYGELRLEESDKAGLMSIALIKGEETHRVWLMEEDWNTLCDHKYILEFTK